MDNVSIPCFIRSHPIWYHLQKHLYAKVVIKLTLMLNRLFFRFGKLLKIR